MEQSESILTALRTSCRNGHAPKFARTYDSTAGETLFALHQDYVTAQWHQIVRGTASTVPQEDIHAALLLLQARMQHVDATDMSLATTLIADYAALVASSSSKGTPECVPDRWNALGREAVRLAVGEPAPALARLPSDTLSRRGNHTDPVETSGAYSAQQQHTMTNSRNERERHFTDVAMGPPVMQPPVENVEEANPRAQNSPPSTSTIGLAKTLLPSLIQACNSLAPSPEHLVPLHADFLALCVHSKFYGLAVDFGLEMRIGIDVEATRITASDIICIHYYLGVAYLALKRYPAALQHFRLALSVPASRLSEVAIAAFKKFVLVSLLVHGNVPTYLKNTSYPAGRLRLCAPEYSDLAKPFENGDINDLRKLMALNQAVFVRDSNVGLVKKLIGAIRERAIIRLTSAYITISLDDLSSKIGSSSRNETEGIVLAMIEEGQIRASVDQRENIVRFDDHDETEIAQLVSSTDMDKEMDRALLFTMKIHQFYKSLANDPVLSTRKRVERDRFSNGDDVVGMNVEDEVLELE